jgi:dihydrodipicolinate synthetase family protein
MKTTINWKGVFPAVTTQFRQDQSLDLDATARHLEVLIASGVSGLIMLGSLGENTWQEIEVWVLAGHDMPSDWVWRVIRAEVNPKEAYFEPFATQQGVHQSPGGGRKTLAQQAARRYHRIRQLCPEDVAALEARIRDWIERKT